MSSEQLCQLSCWPVATMLVMKGKNAGARLWHLVFILLWLSAVLCSRVNINISALVPVNGNRFQRHLYRVTTTDDIVQDHQAIPELCSSLEFFMYDECVLCLTAHISHILIVKSRPHDQNAHDNTVEAESTINYIAAAYHSFRKLQLDKEYYADLQTGAPHDDICIFGQPSLQIFRSILLLNPSRRLIYFTTPGSKVVLPNWLQGSQEIEIVPLSNLGRISDGDELSGAFYTCGVLHLRGRDVDALSIFAQLEGSPGVAAAAVRRSADVIWERMGDVHGSGGHDENVSTIAKIHAEAKEFGIRWDVTGRWPLGSEFARGSGVACGSFTTHTARYEPGTLDGASEEVWIGSYDPLLRGAIKYVAHPPSYSDFVESQPLSIHVNNLNVKRDNVLMIVSFPYNGEPAALLHVKYLFDHVDWFIIIESRVTHSGVTKEKLFMEANFALFRPYLSKLKLVVLERFPEVTEEFIRTYLEMDSGSNYSTYDPSEYPDGFMATQFREEYQREYVREILHTELSREQRYILFVVDADEIVAAERIPQIKANYEYFGSEVVHCRMVLFYYNFKWMKPIIWTPPLLLTDKGVHSKGKLTHMRFGRKASWPGKEEKFNVIAECGWHASYFMNPAGIKRKLESFCHREFDKSEYKNISSIMRKVEVGTDLYDRVSERETLREYNEKDIAQLPSSFQQFQKELLLIQSSTPGKYELERAHIVISIDQTFLIESARGLRDVLLRSGFKNVRISSTPNSVHTYRQILRQMEREMCWIGNCSTNVLQIVLGAHTPVMLFPRYIIFHIENKWEPYIRLPHYRDILRESQAVLLYSDTHREVINEIAGFDQEQSEAKVHCIPMYSQSLFFESFVDYEEYRRSPFAAAGGIDAVTAHRNDSLSTSSIVYLPRYNGKPRSDDTARHTVSTSAGPIIASGQQYIDLLFVGSFSDRRADFARFMHAHAEQDGVKFLSRHSLNGQLETLDLYTREFLGIRSKIVVNYHLENTSVLETHRINNLLALGKVIISERSTEDPDLDKLYEDVLIFVDNQEELYSTALRLLADEPARRRIEKIAIEKYRHIQMDNTAFKGIVLQAVNAQ